MSDTIDNNQTGSTDVPVEPVDPVDPGQPTHTFVQSFSRANVVRLLKAILAALPKGADTADLEAKMALLFPPQHVMPDAPEDTSGYVSIGWTKYYDQTKEIDNEILSNLLETSNPGLTYFLGFDGVDLYYNWIDTVGDDLRTAISCNGSSFERGKVTLAHVIGGDSPKVVFEVLEEEPTILERMENVEYQTQDQETDLGNIDTRTKVLESWKEEMDTWKQDMEQRVSDLETGGAVVNPNPEGPVTGDDSGSGTATT